MKLFCLLCAITVLTSLSSARPQSSGNSQSVPSERAQVMPPRQHRFEPPSPNATAAELEARGDELRAEKYFVDSIEYYRAALAKLNRAATIYNKMGMAELFLQRFHDAQKDFEHAIKLDRNFADAYNNLGVIKYEQRRYGSAVKEYKKAIKFDPNSASYFSNLGSAYFAKKDWIRANEAYTKAVQLDPEVFNRNSRVGVSAQMSSPEDEAKFQFVMAKIYAKNGYTDMALVCLRRSMESGYKDINSVYKDSEFEALRKDPRFTALMANRPASLPE